MARGEPVAHRPGRTRHLRLRLRLPALAGAADHQRTAAHRQMIPDPNASTTRWRSRSLCANIEMVKAHSTPQLEVTTVIHHSMTAGQSRRSSSRRGPSFRTRFPRSVKVSGSAGPWHDHHRLRSCLRGAMRLPRREPRSCAATDHHPLAIPFMTQPSRSGGLGRGLVADPDWPGDGESATDPGSPDGIRHGRRNRRTGPTLP